MSKLKLFAAAIIIGFLGLQYIAMAQETPKNKMKKNQTTNNPKNQTAMTTSNKIEFQPLPYAYDALEPYIDKQTVEIHYSKHHKAYFDNFINATKGTEMESMDMKSIFRNFPEAGSPSRLRFPITWTSTCGSRERTRWRKRSN